MQIRVVSSVWSSVRSIFLVMQIVRDTSAHLMSTWMEDWGHFAKFRSFFFGTLTTLALAPFSFPPILLLSFAYLFQRLLKLEGSGRRHFVEGWWFGFGAFLTSLYWIGHAFLVDAASFAWALPFAVTLMPAGLALFTGIACGLVGYARHKLKASLKDNVVLSLALFIVVLCTGEWLRGHILTGFPWNLTGYVWGGVGAIEQTAWIFGIYGLTFLTLVWAVLGNGLLNQNRLIKFGSLALIITLPLSAHLWGEQRLINKVISPLETRALNVRLVQPGITQADKWKPEMRAVVFQRLLDLSQAPGQDKIDLIIWPESATPFLLEQAKGAQMRIGEMLKANQFLITGIPRNENNDKGERQFFNSVAIIDSNGQLESIYDKVHLVPFGEYLPYYDVLNAIGLSKLTEGQANYKSGDNSPIYEHPSLGKMLFLICYEVIFPDEVDDVLTGDLARTLDGALDKQSSPNFIINLTNDAWFGDSIGPIQHLEMAKFRAIEQGLPLIRAANTGISTVFDAYGQSKDMLGLGDVGHLDQKIEHGYTH
jgi:apolipoprotein N-acyltransferase